MKRILLIDDNDQSTALQVIKDAFDAPLETLYFNPVRPSFFVEDKYAIELVQKELTDLLNSKRIDVIGCDMNLGATHKTTAFKIVKAIREIDQCCTLFLYSGGLTKKLLEYLDEQNDAEGERIIRDLLALRIRRIAKQSREQLKDTIIDLLESPDYSLQVLSFMEEHKDLVLNNKFAKFNGKKLSEISNDIRIQSELGIEFMQLLVEYSIALTVDLNILQ